MFRKPPRELDSELLAAMQKPAEEAVVENSGQQVPLRVHYELKQKPLRNQKLLIALEIKPQTEFASSAYSVKAPEALKIVEPLSVINLGSLKAGETYHEEVVVEPVSEGLYSVEIFFVVEVTGQESQIKMINIPISIGPFQNERKISQ